jgi:hypothetical protein
MKPETIVSYSGTRHIVGTPLGLRVIKSHALRVTCLCGFGVKPGDALQESTRDCVFCLAELAVIARREREQGQQPKEQKAS